MGYQLSRFDSAAKDVLADGERIVGGTWAGTTGAYGQGRAFGVVGRLGSGTAGSFDLPKEFEVAVTDRRLLVFDRSKWTGRPSELLAEIDRPDVVAAELVSDKGKIYTVEVRLTDGRSLGLEIAKAGARKLAESFVETVNTGAVA